MVAKRQPRRRAGLYQAATLACRAAVSRAMPAMVVSRIDLYSTRSESDLTDLIGL